MYNYSVVDEFGSKLWIDRDGLGTKLTKTTVLGLLRRYRGHVP